MSDQQNVATWEAHLAAEFAMREAGATMQTMTDSPHVNHVPTMAGGHGKEEVRRFYERHFIGVNPPDLTITPVSRTVGENALVDEIVVKFTHSCVIDWLLPHIQPTWATVELPVITVIQFENGKIASEHIYWDQACVLVQIGMLDPNTLPVVGRDAARKVLDITLPSNTLMNR